MCRRTIFVRLSFVMTKLYRRMTLVMTELIRMVFIMTKLSRMTFIVKKLNRMTKDIHEDKK